MITHKDIHVGDRVSLHVAGRGDVGCEVFGVYLKPDIIDGVAGVVCTLVEKTNDVVPKTGPMHHLTDVDVMLRCKLLRRRLP